MNKGINKKIILFIFKNYLFNIYKLLHLATFFEGKSTKKKNKKKKNFMFLNVIIFFYRLYGVKGFIWKRKKWIQNLKVGDLELREFKKEF